MEVHQVETTYTVRRIVPGKSRSTVYLSDTSGSGAAQRQMIWPNHAASMLKVGAIVKETRTFEINDP